MKEADLQAECRRLKSDLCESEDRFYKIFHASSNPMTITTIGEGRMIDLNEASARLGGFRREELIGSLAAEHNLWVDPVQRDLVVRSVQTEGKVHDLEVAFRGKHGDVHQVLFSADPIRVNDEPCLLSVSIALNDVASERALPQKTEERRTLVENSVQGVAVFWRRRILFCNRAFAAMTGYSMDELTALPDSKVLLHPDDRSWASSLYPAISEDGTDRRSHQYRIVRKDGAVRWVEVYDSLIDYNGGPAIQIVHVDITDRKNAEQFLRESEERFRLIAETVDEVFWIFEVDRRTTSYLSPAFDRIWGVSREQFVGTTTRIVSMVHPDDRESVTRENERLAQGAPISHEYRIVRPDGVIRHIWDRAFPIFDETGGVKRLIGAGRDITEWREAEAALKEAGEYLHEIINHISDPIFVKDREHRFVLVNDALCRLAGKTHEELLGLAHPPGAMDAPFWEQEEALFETGKECTSEETMRDAQGVTRTIMTKKGLLIDKRGKKQIVGALRDITEYKELEAAVMQAQKMEAIGVLAGGVAHDFNNLLNVINGYSEILLEDIGTDDPMRRDLEQIRDAGRRAAILTSQLLAFGRKQILQPEILNLNTVVESMSSMLRPMIGEDIELVCACSPDLWPVNADPGRMQQIILNLAVNAREAMPHGGRLAIETTNVELGDGYTPDHPRSKAGAYVMLSVSDNGTGMDDATRSRIFEPFFTTKGRGRGTGLGLSTVYGIVKQSNGIVWVQSEPKRGASFRVYLPRATAEEVQAHAASELEPSLRGSETVLVVEDEAPVRALACQILSDRGYRVLDAPNGDEALRIADTFVGTIHVLVTDVVMPGMNGRELAAALEKKRRGLKVLFISGYTDAVLDHGVVDPDRAFLQKPFTVEAIARKVRAVLGSHHS